MIMTHNSEKKGKQLLRARWRSDNKERECNKIFIFFVMAILIYYFLADITLTNIHKSPNQGND